MFKNLRRVPATVALCFSLSLPAALHAQEEPQQQAAEEEAYGTRFFDQLRSIFGRFRDADLQRVFQSAERIQCSELVVARGEWRTVAFFNEDRTLGDWCRNSLDEVKADLSVYIFKGTCRGGQENIQLSTEFPVGDGIEAYNAGRIRLDQVDVNVNEPVRVVFDPRTQAYTFDLPYLFLTGRRSSGNIYSLISPHVGDAYATDVISRSECKAVKSNDVTYRFLICRTTTVGRGSSARDLDRRQAFGASAYFILSDGVEAQSSVTLSFGAVDAPAAKPADAAPAAVPDAPRTVPEVERPKLVARWRGLDPRERIIEAGKHEFRLKFSPQAWRGKIGAPTIVFGQKLVNPQTARLPESADYCTWHPGVAALTDRLLADEPDADVSYFVESTDRAGRSAPAVVFEIKSRAGARLGTLQCFFPRVDSATNVTFDRWVSIVGANLTLEIRQ